MCRRVNFKLNVSQGTAFSLSFSPPFTDMSRLEYKLETNTIAEEQVDGPKSHPKRVPIFYRCLGPSVFTVPLTLF